MKLQTEKKHFIVTFPYNHTHEDLKQVREDMVGFNYYIVFTTDSGEITKTEVSAEKFKEYIEA